MEDNPTTAAFPFRCDETIPCPGAVHQTCGCTDHSKTEQFAIVYDIGGQPSPGESEGLRCPEENAQLTGPTIKHDYDVKTWSECGEKCRELEECSHWTFGYHSGESHGCFLKSGAGDKKANEGFVSGTKQCTVNKGTVE